MILMLSVAGQPCWHIPFAVQVKSIRTGRRQESQERVSVAVSGASSNG